VLGEAVIEICIYRYGIDHNRQLCNAPSHDESTSAKMLLKGSAKNHKPADIQRYSKITGPMLNIRFG
jgi:hypothetical protein